MGTSELARPGGSQAQAQRYFDQASPLLARAEGIAQATQDKAAFIALLQAALSTAQTHPNLASELMREHALWLLGKADDLF